MKIKNFFAPLIIALLALSGTAYSGEIALTENVYSPKPINHFPNTKSNYKVLVGDFHIHTAYGHDGLKVEDRMLDAYAWGLDILAITEHGNIWGSVPIYDKNGTPQSSETERQVMDLFKIAEPLADKYGILLFKGVETGINGKEHIVAFNIPDDYKADAYDHWLAEEPGLKQAYYRERFNELTKDGGFMIYVHPHYGYARDAVQWGVDNKHIRGVEVENGWDNDESAEVWGASPSHGGWHWEKSFAYALENNLAIFANTDAHGERGATFTLVLAKEKTNKSVMEAIEDRRTVGYFSGMLWGRERDLVDIISTAVTVTKVDIDKTTQVVRISNKSPMELTAGIMGKDIKIPAGDNVIVKNDTGKKNIVINWKNLWVSSTETLRMRY